MGRRVQTTDREIIEVKLREIDNAEKVRLVERPGLSAKHRHGSLVHAP